EQAAILARVSAEIVHIDNVTFRDPKHTQDVRVALQQETHELADLVRHGVPLADESLLDLLPSEAEIVLDWPDVDAHNIFVVDAVRVVLRDVHVVRNRAAITKKDQV